MVDDGALFTPLGFVRDVVDDGRVDELLLRDGVFCGRTPFDDEEELFFDGETAGLFDDEEGFVTPGCDEDGDDGRADGLSCGVFLLSPGRLFMPF